MKKIFSILILGAFTGILLGLISNLAKPNQRLPSSTLLAKQWQGKHQRLLGVTIENQSGLPPSDDKELVLKAKIWGLQPILGEVHYRWILPPEASLVAGELSDSVESLPDPKKFIDRDLTLLGVSAEGPEPKLIILQVYTEIDGVNIGSTAVFSTQPEIKTKSPAAEEKSASESLDLPKHIQQ